MSIESLKQQARKHEQNEDWQKALDQYNKALNELAREDQVDIGLYNRVGDLYVRVGNLAEAVDHYEKAVELYREAYLPNNAIAVCKKVIRNVPTRHKAYLVIGQIRAEQGFLPDARTNFLTYAERMQQDGELDESFRALVEFCDLAPDDVGVRITVADQMAVNGRKDDAVAQYRLAYRHYTVVGNDAAARELESKIRAIDPDADVSALQAVSGFGGSLGSDDDVMSDFGEISLDGGGFGGGGFGSRTEATISGAAGDENDEADDSDAGVEVEAGLEGFEIASPATGSGDEEDEADDDAVELPIMAFDDEDAGDAPESFEMPTFDVFADDADGAEAGEEGDAGVETDEPVELPLMDFADEPSAAEVADRFEEASAAVEDAMEDALDEVGADLSDALVMPSFDDEPAAEDTSISFEFEGEVPAVEVEEAGASPVAESPETVADAPPVEPRAPEPPPVAAIPEPPDGGYIDFGAMILGGGAEKTTRFKVAYEEPSGDEEADFAKMLSQFKDKVSENLDSSDVRAHYDLGTAYKEMGLLDEAISSFQSALRASSDHLPTYEIMGQTFIEMGKPEAAVKSLVRAVESADTVEDELVGIYYYLGRAYEALADKESALEFYDRVFSLDINFADVTERLRELR